jgi:hypothetical protein
MVCKHNIVLILFYRFRGALSTRSGAPKRPRKAQIPGAGPSAVPSRTIFGRLHVFRRFGALFYRRARPEKNLRGRVFLSKRSLPRTRAFISQNFVNLLLISSKLSYFPLHGSQKMIESV